MPSVSELIYSIQTSPDGRQQRSNAGSLNRLSKLCQYLLVLAEDIQSSTILIYGPQNYKSTTCSKFYFGTSNNINSIFTIIYEAKKAYSILKI